MKKIIIFGTGMIADVVAYYAEVECGFEIEAYTVNSEYCTIETFHGKPVVPFEEIDKKYNPDVYDMFVAIGYHKLNALREDVFNSAIKMGYKLVSIISPNCSLPSNITYGNNCFIMPPCIIQPYVTLGNNIFVWNGALVGHHSKIGDHAWLTSSCNIGGNVNIGNNTFVAMNATIGQGVHIGKSCFLGSNTLITKNLRDDKVVISESSKAIKLDSQQFLRMTEFDRR